MERVEINMDLPNNPFINSTLGLFDGDIQAAKLRGLDTTIWGSECALTLATIDAMSLNYNLNDIMNSFERWAQNGAYTADGEVRHIGRTTQQALERFAQAQDPFSSGGIADDDNGSGALTRMMPVIFYVYTKYGSDFINDEAAMLILHQVAGLTHNHPRGLMGIGFYAILVGQILDGFDFLNALDRAIGITYEYYAEHAIFMPFLSEFDNLNTPDFMNQSKDDLNVTGYVVQSLEALVWVFLNTTSYQEALDVTQTVPGKPEAIMPLIGSLGAVLYQKHTWPNLTDLLQQNPQLNAILQRGSQSGVFY